MTMEFDAPVLLGNKKKIKKQNTLKEGNGQTLGAAQLLDPKKLKT